MYISIEDFYEKLYIIAIKNLGFHFSHICTFGNSHCSKELYEAFNCRGSYQDVKVCRDYDERVVKTIFNQIQSEYYDFN